MQNFVQYAYNCVYTKMLWKTKQRNWNACATRKTNARVLDTSAAFEIRLHVVIILLHKGSVYAYLQTSLFSHFLRAYNIAVLFVTKFDLLSI